MVDLCSGMTRILGELRSDHAPTRNKAIEQLDQKLNNSKEDLLALLKKKHVELTWQEIFNTAVSATIKHATSISECRPDKAQTLKNKSNNYSKVLNNIINYNLEADKNYFLGKTTIVDTFEEGFKKRIVVEHFGLTFLNMLERGIYMSPINVRQIKVNEYSRILSYLFEVNVEGDELLRSRILKCITKTVELASKRVQLHSDLVAYLPQLSANIMAANTNDKKTEVVRLYLLFVKELSVNYHQSLCLHMQDILPMLCELYHKDSYRDDTKNMFFQSVALSLRVFYPKLSAGDFNTFNIAVNESWPKTMLKLRTIIDMEIRSNSLPRYKSSQLSNDRFSEDFFKMSALVIYILLWHFEFKKSGNEDDPCKKIARPLDKLETLFNFIDKKGSTFNDVWFSIFTELIQLSDSIINVANFKQTLETASDILRMFGNPKNLMNVRVCLTCLLKREQELEESKSMSENYLADLWCQLGDYIISEPSSSAKVIVEKQIIIRALITHGKLTPKQCSTLLQYIRSNEVLMRNECIETIRDLFLHAERCGIDKASVELEPVIKWAYDTCDKHSATKAIHNIDAIKPHLLADTFAIGIINFLDDRQLKNLKAAAHSSIPPTDSELQTLTIKYNRKLLCLFERDQLTDRTVNESNVKNCLFQNNYELLMRMLNYETTKDFQITNILKDLHALHNLSCTMERLLHYKVFDATNFTQCPLIKRVGLYLSHLEFQLKSSIVTKMDDKELVQMLKQVDTVLKIYTSNEILVHYLESQPLEELITFVSSALYHNRTQNKEEDNKIWLNIWSLCLDVLGNLCVASSHRQDAFQHISSKKIILQLQDILIVAKMLCRCKDLSDEIITWLVNMLKSLFRLHYMDLDFVEEVLDYMPTITFFASANEDPLADMLIALNSLLKVALKKSYPEGITAKILRCVGLIAQQCSNIFADQNFAAICKSVAKFLIFPTLEIQFATISTLTVLMNTSCVSNDPVAAFESHMNFCEDLYESIDWRKLCFDTDDLKQNNISVTVQALISIFTFSSFHQEIVLSDLLYFCALHKLNVADFYALSSRVEYYRQTVQELIMPYADFLIQKWISKQYPISKFPYFLCYNTNQEFRKANAKRILAYLILYGSQEELKRFRDQTSDSILKESTLILSAYMLPKAIACPESESCDYKQRYKFLTQNLQQIGVSDEQMSVSFNPFTLYNVMKLLFDKMEMQRFFGFVYCNKKPEWYNLKSDSLFNCFTNHILDGINKNMGMLNSEAAFRHLITKQPITLITLLGVLKTKCYDSVFPMHNLQNFFLYCAIAEHVLKFCHILQDTGKNNILCDFFVCDILFFIPNFILHTNCCVVQKAALQYFSLILTCDFVNFEKLQKRLNEIAKLFLQCVFHIKGNEMKMQAVAILKALIETNENLIDAGSLLDEYPKNEIPSSLHKYCDGNSSTIDQDDVEAFINEFLQNYRVERLRTLRTYIAKHKNELQKNSTLLFQLFDRLIKILRTATKRQSSIDALKCLAELGPLEMKHVSYYFQTDFDSFEEGDDDRNHQFVTVLYETLEKQLFNFNPSTHAAFVNVARQVANSKIGLKLIGAHPNFSVFVVKSNQQYYLNTQIPIIDWLLVLQSTENFEYEEWICAFMAAVFKNCGWHGFDLFAEKSFSFAEACLQPFVKLLLADKDMHLETLSTMLDYFFEQFCRTGSKGIFHEKRAIKMFLSMCECIRVVNQWSLPINICNVIKASNHCQAYFLSIMYLELWGWSDSNAIQTQEFQSAAKKAYESIGCTEAIAGFMDPFVSRVEFLNLNNSWSDILLELDDFEMRNSDLCMEMLKRNGMEELFAKLEQRCSKNVNYEGLWRLMQWDEPIEGNLNVNMAAVNMEHEFKKHHYVALKSIRNREEENSISAIANAYQCVLAILRDISVESLQSVYKYLSWLATLQQAEDFCQVQFSQQVALTDIFEKWQVELNLKYGNFSCKEYTLSHQIALFQMGGTRANRRAQQFYKKSPIDTYLLKTITECKKAGKLNLARKNIAKLRKMPELNAATQISVLLEDADVFIKTGNQQIADAILKNTVTNKDFMYCLERCGALRMRGEFLMNSNAQSFKSTLDDSFNASLKSLGDFEAKKMQLFDKYPALYRTDAFDAYIRDNRKSAYASIAKYADFEYQRLDAYLKSDEYSTLCKIIQKNREMAATVGHRENKDKQLGAMNAKRFATMDENGLKLMQANHTEHLCTAVTNYIAFCQHDESFSSDAVNRIIALWLPNKSNTALNNMIKDSIQSVPSYKFISVFNQLCAHLNSQNSEFLDILIELLVRCAQEHPHHSLNHLYALVYADQDNSSASTSERPKIAKRIIGRVTDQEAINCSRDLNMLFPSLIEFANEEVPRNNRVAKLPISKKLLRIRNLDIHCPTIELDVSPNMQYNIITIVRWEPDFRMVGGLNAPKKLMCLCSDGKTRAQLLKGKDDLRQDAIMQQVFHSINDLINKEPEFIERKLRLRTYKITPLSARSGILEWCENTIPMGMYLQGDGKNAGAHQRYRPQDWAPVKCRHQFKTVESEPVERRVEIYKQLTEKIKPVFQYFFFEKFHVPGIWFEKRLAFTNSVATTSMVGYILGLGDRHLQNILLDQSTAEVVHIDFGIAFEQGKILRTPEQVPFRLTRDFVAAMGVCGTNGVFTKSCEATLHILRRYKSIITTLLEVLLHDPLFIWGVLKNQNQVSGETTNLFAQRSLMVVQKKLEGNDSGVLGSSTVEVQVQRLINEATFPNNLGAMYNGWEPYL
ncbi:serine/threonine-protein kinase ATM [Scaptodrosophila lebanonensis]|uniref:Serine/threonine-protein kinase ATM n=1 Tax=Drosophila lebanonensis TaxID=7225 RepID=A0A6J2U298_DROLE|nr:serine/threonine-protein kinase ATM [Scaptodrosophila lebanonensis]